MTIFVLLKPPSLGQGCRCRATKDCNREGMGKLIALQYMQNIQIHLKGDNNGNVYSVDIMNQDYIYCGKKLSYPLDHAKRTIMLGPNMAHILHLKLCISNFKDSKEVQLKKNNYVYSTVNEFVCFSRSQ